MSNNQQTNQIKTLLLGAQGMLGRALAEVFAGPSLTTWTLIDLDITDSLALARKITALQPKLIINAAAYTNVDGAEDNYEEALAVNATALKSISEAAKQIDATVIHYSTDYVFPGNNQKGYREDDLPGPPINKYGQTKLAGEKILQDINPRHYLLRTAWLYGAGGKNFVDTMLRASQTHHQLSVVNDQFGSPTYTLDLAKATKDIIWGPFKPGIYHTVNSGVTTWCDFSQRIFEQAQIDIKVNAISASEYPLPAQRPKYSVLNNTKGPKLRPWQEALADYIKDHRS